MGYDYDESGEAVRVAEDEYDDDVSITELKEAQFNALTDTVQSLLEVIAAARNFLPLDQWARVDRLVKNGRTLLDQITP